MELKSFLILLGLSLVSAKVHWRNVHEYTFDKFVAEHNLGYKTGTSEYSLRKEIFEKELKRVIAHNSVTDANRKESSWKETINHMSAMTAQEKKAYNGRNKSVAQASKKTKLKNQVDYPENYKMMPVSRLPKEVDWRTAGYYATSVKDQGHCGSCWAFASTAVMESHAAINTGLLFDLSPQQVAACAPNPDECGGTGNCNGATSELAFDYIAGSEGLVESFQYPYTEYDGVESSCAVPAKTVSKVQSEGFIQLASNNYEELMNAIAREGPVAVSVDASEWHSYDSGIFNGCNQVNPDINHAVTLMGYGTDNGQKYWLIRNSWSASFGEAGYIRIARDDGDDSQCGTDITPEDGTACAGDHEPQTVCGTCGVLFDSAYPTGVTAA